MPVLKLLKENPIPGPWELMPGRSIREDWANGRKNFEFIEEAGLIHKSNLICYEIVEFEPTVPGFVVQYDEIRRVLTQESRFADEAIGIMANSQQPIISLHNLFFYAKASLDLAYLNKKNDEILADFADFLGADREVFCRAINCTELQLEDLGEDLPEKLRNSQLKSEVAACIPGGPEMYLNILAKFAEARIAVLKCLAAPLADSDQIVQHIAETVEAIYQWWLVHQYTGTGQGENRFNWRYTHFKLALPFLEWIRNDLDDPRELLDKTLKRLSNYEIGRLENINELMTSLLNGEVRVRILGGKK